MLIILVCFLQMAEGGSSNSDVIPKEKDGDGEHPYSGANFERFKSRFRSLDIEIINRTGNELRFVEEEFLHGTWYVSPDPVNIKPGDTSLALVCSKKFSAVGVTGGLIYELSGKGKYLCIGFDNPVIGQMKTFIELSNTVKSAKWACSQLKSGSVKNLTYNGYDAMAVIKPPKQSRFRLMQYILEEKKI